MDSASRRRVLEGTLAKVYAALCVHVQAYGRVVRALIYVLEYCLFLQGPILVELDEASGANE